MRMMYTWHLHGFSVRDIFKISKIFIPIGWRWASSSSLMPYPQLTSSLKLSTTGFVKPQPHDLSLPPRHPSFTFLHTYSPNVKPTTSKFFELSSIAIATVVVGLNEFGRGVKSFRSVKST